ncbi:MAG: hypothetical protein GY801_28945 [bacterium]|nr:hypothetical protein [bacterium]
MKTLPLNISYQDSSRNRTGRRILLLEPGYRNKYPPLGLMKLSAYHKNLGDTVVFLKGDYFKYFLDEKFEKCLAKIKQQDFDLENWEAFECLIRDYLRVRRQAILEEILTLVPNGYFYTVENLLKHYAYNYSPERRWDRVYVTTLFTFYWKETIKAFQFAKKIVKSLEGLYIGGVAASLIHELFEEDTGLIAGKNIIIGLLDKPGILDDNEIVIDEITPDYSILETIDYSYPLDTGYLTYTTKGCKRGCEFCAVPKLEPAYKDRLPLEKQISKIAGMYGERKDLILMDNNVLCSPKFPEIIREILALGFTKGARYVAPNRFEILTNYLLKEDNIHNEQKYLQQAYHFLTCFGKRRIKGENAQKRYYQLLQEQGLDSLETFSKEKLLDSRKEINAFIEKYRSKIPKRRYVDFNQGLDCRYIDEEKMLLLSQLPIRPMRIAFDSLALRERYESAVRLADKYGVHHLSNYILFNYKDKPEELWLRLKINNDLNRELQTEIYSFPMKFVPMYGEASKSRSYHSYIGKHWHPKYLRAVQCILNATKGVVSVNPAFFERAFGKDLDGYFTLLMMPEPYIMYRDRFEENGKTASWIDQYKNLNRLQLNEAQAIILTNDFSSFNGSTSGAVVEFMKHYQLKYRPEKKKNA